MVLSKKMKRMRLILEAYAKRNSFDPLDAENWYSLRKKTVASIKVSSLLSSFFFFSLPLDSLHPFLSLLTVLLKGGSTILKHFRNSHVNALLELFPEIGLEVNKFVGVPSKYNSLFSSFSLLFSSSLLRFLFVNSPLRLGHYWADLKNRRQFLMDVAKRERFDPKVASNWYKLTLNNFLSHKVRR